MQTLNLNSYENICKGFMGMFLLNSLLIMYVLNGLLLNHLFNNNKWQKNYIIVQTTVNSTQV